MTDHPTAKKPHSLNNDRIDVSTDYELDYWANKYFVTTDRLKEVVSVVGPLVKSVERYLNIKQPRISYL